MKPVMATKTSAFQEPNTDGYGVSETARAKKKRGERNCLLIYLLAYFFIFLWLLRVPTLSVFFRKGNYEALRSARARLSCK